MKSTAKRAVLTGSRGGGATAAENQAGRSSWWQKRVKKRKLARETGQRRAGKSEVLKSARHRNNEPRLHRRRQHFTKAPPPEPADAIFERRRQIQAIARSRQRYVQQTLALLAIARLRILVRLRLVVGDRDRSVAARIVDDANRRAETAGAATHVDQEHDRELQSFRGRDRP